MTQLIVGFFDAVANFIATYLPSFTLGNGVLSKVIDAFTYFISMISNLNWLVPVSDVLLIISLLIGYKLTLFTVFVVNWIIRRIADVIP